MKNFTKSMLLLALMFFSFGAIAQPTVPPTAPTEPAINVISIYGTDSYTPITGVKCFEDWGQTGNGSTIGDYTIPGTEHKVLKYGNLSFQGIDFTDNAQDVSSMKYLHMDIWTADAAATPLWVSLISGNQNIDVSNTITTDGSWYSLDIPLSAYTGSNLASINQLMFKTDEWRTNATNNSSATIYLDNIYFWTDETPAIVLSASKLNVGSAEGSTGTFDITASDTWSVESSETWLTPSSTSGTGNATITLTATANTEMASRTAVITVTGADASTKTVTVTQSGIPVSDPIAPTSAAEDVIAVYSDEYTPVTVTFQNWYGTSIVEESSVTETNMVNKVTSECCFGYEFSSAQDLSAMENLHIDIYPTTITSITIGIVANLEHKKTITLTPNVWNPINISLSELTTAENLAAVAQVGFWDIAGTFYMDNLYFYKGGDDTEAPTGFTATTGAVTTESVEFVLNATDNSGAVTYKISYGDGPTVVSVPGVSGTEKSYILKGLDPSTAYSFSVTAQDAAENAAENNPITLDATTLDLTAAPDPSLDGSVVTSIYSDVYTNLSGTSFYENWGQSTQVSEIQLGTANNTLKYSNFNYVGIVLEGTLDASTMDSLHIDIYSEFETAIKITPISAGAEFLVTLTPLTPGQWNSINIPLSDFTGVALNQIIQFKFDGGTGNTFYMDNLVLFAEDTEAPAAFTATAGTLTSESIELLLNATDDSGVITYEVSYGSGPTVLTTTGTSGVEKSFIVTGLTSSTEYTFSVSAMDAAGNAASNNPLVVTATTENATGIHNQEQDGFNIYPNPVKGEFIVSSNLTIDNIRIYNIQGQEVKTYSMNALRKSFDANELQAGYYFVIIKYQDGAIKARKFIKE